MPISTQIYENLQLDSLPDEEWLPVPGYEGRYDVSNMGRVRSYLSRDGRKPRMTPQHLLRQVGNPSGYRIVGLMCDGRLRTVTVHSLVLKAFVGNRPSGQVACHKGDARLDNRLSMLRWDTQASNIIEARSHRKMNSKLNADQVREIREIEIPRGVSYRMIGVKYGVSDETIRHIRLRKTWKYI